MRRRTAGVAVASLMLLAGVASVFFLYGSSSGSSPAMGRATEYLLAGYNPSIGMVSETPNGSTYFVYSDNFLVAHILAGSGNATIRAIGANITSTDERFLGTVPHPSNQYQVITSSNGSFFASNNYVLSREGSSIIEATLNNGTAPLSPASYADVAFLEALYFHQVHDNNYAISEFNLGAKLYDGRGFVDKAFSGGEYQTYKLALYDYVGKVIGAVLPKGLDATLASLQAPDGGFYTGYTAGFVPNGSTNTETTSLAILALSMPGFSPALPYSSYVPVFVLAVAAIVLAEAFIMRRRSRRERATSNAVHFS